MDWCNNNGKISEKGERFIFLSQILRNKDKLYWLTCVHTFFFPQVTERANEKSPRALPFRSVITCLSVWRTWPQGNAYCPALSRGRDRSCRPRHSPSCCIESGGGSTSSGSSSWHEMHASTRSHHVSAHLTAAAAATCSPTRLYHDAFQWSVGRDGRDWLIATFAKWFSG